MTARFLRRAVLALALGVAALASPSLASPARADDRERIIGNWKLVTVTYEDPATGARTYPLGEHPTGYQIATAGGRWLALVTAEGRPVPGTDAERAAALRSMISYTGRWRVQGDRVVTRVEAAWNQAWVGTDQERIFRFEGNRLHLVGPPQPHPNLLGQVVRIIVTWERDE
ncbi:lipocalin-like domain-containing protein [Roseomonas populi]|uniref:Lipocalin-like domain-containing protein n=1 Tax=Roseomonas populi TaxID=3121582 RepID=A0ABT1X5H5_9PROT|nr:lipocalin-like domain-containing protein [Roseomonas pecuniae]MCR0983360.1 lipocalin-like domain-containing protein [Roseomonas pecuniae]